MVIRSVLNPIFPAGAIGLESDPKMLEICHNTIDEMLGGVQRKRYLVVLHGMCPLRVRSQDYLAKLHGPMRPHKPSQILFCTYGGGDRKLWSIDGIDEMLLQSYEGVIRIFPDWPKDEDARFGNLRAVGAFLVSAELKNGAATGVKILSEKGRDCTVQNPWPGRRVILLRNSRPVQIFSGARFIFKTGVNDLVELKSE